MSIKTYKVPFSEASAEFVEKKSRFVGNIFKVDSAEQASEIIRMMDKKHHEAAHNVYAYILKNGVMRFSDNGEPQGTAGMPTLDVLRKEEIFDVLCVTTRWFGGILLGAGGLVRAYSHACKIALDAAGIAEMRPFSTATLTCAYSYIDGLRRLLPDFDAQERNTEYTAEVCMDISLPAERFEQFCTAVSDFSNGSLHPVSTGICMLPHRIS